MAKFTVKVNAYQGSPIFDLHASGHNIAAVQIAEERGLYGTKQVYTFETKNDAELEITIKKLKGDVDIELPTGWGIDTDVEELNDSGLRLPNVTVNRDNVCTFLGYIAKPSLQINFFKEHEIVSFCREETN